MASGLASVFTVPMVFSVLRSKMVAVLARPLLMKPRPRSEAMAMPWTPGVSGMSPSMA